MISGEVLHRDSLGYQQVIRPGQVNLMTAGRGIAHSEESPLQRSSELHLAQLWIALPEAQRNMEPAFEHYPDLPTASAGDFAATVLVGAACGQESPVKVHSPLVAVDLFAATANARGSMALHPDFEYGVMVLDGEARVDDEAVGAGTLLYLGIGHDKLEFAAIGTGNTRLLLIGGEPFAETLLLWWNFVARSEDEIVRATRDWNDSDYFGSVEGFDGARLVAPAPPEHIRASR